MNRKPAVSREFLFTAACCIWPPSERRASAIQTAATATLDWDRILRIVNRQRVAGLVHDGLVRAGIAPPVAVGERLRNQASGIVRQNFQFATEAVRLQRLLNEAGVTVLFVKGISLAVRAYTTLGLKHSWDIDLLVTSEAVPQAIQVLEQAGYCGFPLLPPITDSRYRRWVKYGREYVLRHKANGVHVELHWKLVDNDYFLSGVSAASPSQLVRISNDAQLRTLNDDDLFVYLCVHGAMHGWSRLKWLADVAAFVAKDGVGDPERRLRYAKKVNAEHCVAQAFLLCDSLFATPSLTGISQLLRRRRRYRWLERIALTAMMNGNAEVELGNGPFDLNSIYMSHFMLGRGWRFATTELSNKLNAPFDLMYGTLPPRFHFLYPVKRVTSWIKRRGRVRVLPIMQTSTSETLSPIDQIETPRPDRTGQHSPRGERS